MSLDLYIESNTPVQHKGTGSIYIRENGETKELLTKGEVLKHFPDVNPDDIKEIISETNEYFHINITHNLTEMADECVIKSTCSNKKNHITLYDLMWHPKENLDITTPTASYLEDLETCYDRLVNNTDFFKNYNPENGWGTYESLVKKTKAFIDALHSISLEFENYKIVSNT